MSSQHRGLTSHESQLQIEAKCRTIDPGWGILLLDLKVENLHIVWELRFSAWLGLGNAHTHVYVLQLYINLQLFNSSIIMISFISIVK